MHREVARLTRVAVGGIAAPGPGRQAGTKQPHTPIVRSAACLATHGHQCRAAALWSAGRPHASWAARGGRSMLQRRQQQHSGPECAAAFQRCHVGRPLRSRAFPPAGASRLRFRGAACEEGGSSPPVCQPPVPTGEAGWCNTPFGGTRRCHLLGEGVGRVWARTLKAQVLLHNRGPSGRCGCRSQLWSNWQVGRWWLVAKP